MMERPTATKNKAEHINSSSLSRGILQRKCACGNRSFGRGECDGCGKNQFLQRRTVHISEPGDWYEQEADRIAAQVMGIPKPMIQHQVELEKKDVVHRKEIVNSITPLQVSSTGQEEVSEVPPIVDEVVRSPGRPLDASTRSFMESRFGKDFSQVRVHTDSAAVDAARAVQSRAYTFGQHIVFGSGEYNPTTFKGQELVAHELTHVVQQGGGRNRFIQRKSWEDSASNCVTTQKILVQLLFKDNGQDVWDESRKVKFRSDFKASIENSFNSNTYRIKPANAIGTRFILPDINCPCSTAGFKPQVEINLVSDGALSVAEDWEIDVIANSTPGNYLESSTNTSYGDLDELDNQAVPKEGHAPGVNQIPTVHEFGHFLGLDHPGAGLNEGITLGGMEVTKRELSPGADQYTHVGKDKKGRVVDGTIDLMGSGDKLRPFYFDSWTEHIISRYGSECEWSII
jgi:hypothetical protein